MSDRIWLRDSNYEPTKEELLDKAAEVPISRCFTIEASLDEEGVAVIGYPDSELGDLDVPMRIKISDGMSQGDFLFYWRKIAEEARSNWATFSYYLRLYYSSDEPLDAPCGVYHGDTD